MFKFLHAADVHLDSPLVGLEQRADAPAQILRAATRRALENMIQLAIDEQVAFVLLAGDLYDGDWKDYNTGIFLVRQMVRLNEQGIQVLMVSGNHDAANQMTRSLHLPDNVHHFPPGRAGTRVLDDLGVAVHGRSFATKAVTEDLAAGYPAAIAGCFNVGLLHTSLDGREGHAEYAPCSLDGLRAKHYQYWALGHVHAREIVARDPWIVFPGNTQGRHVRETGPKGCTLVSVEDLEVRDVREARLDVLCWSHCAVDVSGAATAEAALERVARRLREQADAAGVRLLAARVVLRGATAAHGALKGNPDRWAEELRALVLDRVGEAAWLEKIAFCTAPESSIDLGPLGGLLVEQEDDGALVAELAKELTALRAKLPAELLEPPDPIDPTDPKTIEEALRDARGLLLGRLGGAP
ncbi:MAG: DNA repair exonuclease [Deltaproteobacteria bacterium]|nr:DNA repair exonuclease [Deltaproteobacteria bacterium]